MADSELSKRIRAMALSSASDETLREKVIPKTDKHLSPAQIEVLRRSALRALEYANSAENQA